MLYAYNDEPTNENRAAWAREAVSRFAELTRHDARYIDDADALTETVQDFLGDVLHLLRSNDVALGPVLLGAFSCFAEECAEEGESIPDLTDVLCAACTPGYSFDVQPHRAPATVGRRNHEARTSYRV